VFSYKGEPIGTFVIEVPEYVMNRMDRGSRKIISLLRKKLNRNDIYYKIIN